MKEQIIEILTNTNKKMTISDITKSLNEKDENKVLVLLNELEKEYLVYKTNKNKYMLFSRNEFYRIGVLSLNKKGFGFVFNANYEEDLFIPFKHLNGAVADDTVLVSVNKEENSGKVIKIVKRDLNNLVGEVVFEKNKAYAILDDGRKELKILIKDSKLKDCVNGTKVKIEIVKEKNNSSYIAKIIKIIGHKNDPGVDIKSISLRFGFDEEFSDEVNDYVEKIPHEVLTDELVGRRDLTKEEIFTIDGDDTKDIDDALSLEMNGNLYRLGVHIADVSHYVKLNSILDKEALSRGTSCYLVDSVIPMLPHKLSNGICSLNPNQVRLTLSCVMDIDLKGNVVSYEIFPSYIKSKIQMTYKKVNDILMRDIVDQEYESYKNKLLKMNELAHILRKYKINRGYLDFDIEEAKIIVNDLGEAVDIVLRTREDGEKLIEDFMIVANETVALDISNKGLPFIYRTHEKPTPEKIESFLNSAVLFDYKQTEKLRNYEAKSIQKILDEVILLDKKDILTSLLLRSMKKALYTKDNYGHYGLASPCYTHFTSPIRRYPDLVVHRLLRRYIFDQNTKGDLSSELSYIAEQSSLREQAAIEAEREVFDMKAAEYMSKHIGETFEGTISGVNNFGFFVSLQNLIEGLVHISTLEGDNFANDELSHTIAGEHHGQRYRLGDQVKVKVVKAEKETGQIDFIIVGEDNGN